MANITFTQQQRDTLSSLTAGGTADFYLGYDYLRGLLSALTSAEVSVMGVTQAEVDERIYWLSKASAINQNDLSDAANNFIRDVTRYGLLWDGLPEGNIQFNSNKIGETVIGTILDQRVFPPIADIVGSDVQAAIHLGRQTIGGWGGAFYYWDEPYAAGGDDATIGSTILATGAELEKFISVASCASFSAICRTVVDPLNPANWATITGALLEMWDTSNKAAVPQAIKDEIIERARDYYFGLRTHFSDNPLSWEWEKSLDFSNAVGVAQAGQHGFDINLITGWVHGIEYGHEDFQTFFKIESVVGSNLGDIITLDGTLPLVEIQAGSGDDKIYATGGTVMATGGGGDDLFSTNSYSTEVDFARHGETLTIKGTTATFTYVLENFDWVQFYDVTISFEDLLNDIEQVILGTPGVDVLHGTSRKDIIKGFAGDDQIYGHEGADVIYGGGDNDTIYGGTGSDAMFGDDGIDTFHLADGDAGDLDYINGGAGNDIVRMTSEATFRLDQSLAGEIRSRVTADGFAAPTGYGIGIEMQNAEAFVQSVDTVYAAAAANELRISTVLDITNAGVLTYDFTAGALDAGYFDGTTAYLNLMGAAGVSKAAATSVFTNSFLGIDEWHLTSGNNTVVVAASHVGVGAVSIYGNGGNDILRLSSFTTALTVGSGVAIEGVGITAYDFYQIETGSGNDTVYGSDAASYFHGGTGINTFHGSLGADTLISTGSMIVDYSASQVAVIFNNGGTDRSATGSSWSLLSMAAGDVLKTTTWSDITGSTSQDTLWVVGQYGTLRSNGGNDTLNGRDKNDTLIGSDGYAEIMKPGDGNDTIQFGTGGGTLDFSTSTRAANIDMAAGTYLFGDQTDTVSGEFTKLVGTSYSDTIAGTEGADNIDGYTGNGLDTVFGRGGNDTIKIYRGTAYGGDGEDTITGSISVSVYGDTGNDTLSVGTNSFAYGGADDDTLTGLEGSTLFGDGGEDTLTTSSDNVRMIGGSGADTFTFSTYGTGARSTLSYSTSGEGVTLRSIGQKVFGYDGDAQGDEITGSFHLEGSDHIDDIRITGFQYMNVYAGAGDDYIDIALKSSVTIYGGTGEDEIILKRGQTAYGEADNDTFRGVGTMYGGANDDTFHLELDFYYNSWAGTIGNGTPIWAGGNVDGGAGNNTIYGGGGDDSIAMSAGANTFIFATGGRKDTVTGAGVDDVIRLDGVLAFSSMSDVNERLLQVGNNVLFDLGKKSDHQDVYGANAPDDWIGSIQFNNMTIAQVSALNWEFV